MKMMPGPLTLGDIFRMPEFFLGLAAILLAVVGGATTAHGDITGIPSLVAAIIMIISVMISLGYFGERRFRGMFSLTTIAAVMGIQMLVNSILIFWGLGRFEEWTGWTILISSLLALYAAYLSLPAPPASPL
jgi:phosphatidylserine synthase